MNCRYGTLGIFIMHLVYLDESGNTGMNLNDHEQPVFVLCALVVAEENWQSLERDLIATLNTHIPTRLEGFEMHAHHLRNGCGHFKGVSVAERLAIRNSWLELLGRHGCRVIYRAIEKKRFQRWLHHNFGTSGIVLNPHVAAFPLLAQVVNDYLRGLPGRPRGMFISDENKEIISDVEKTITILRGVEGALRLTQIVEKGFFINSKSSHPLQLCDLCALSLRKKEEVNLGRPPKSIDESAIEIIEPHVHRGDEAFVDIMRWLTEQQKKERPGK